MSTEPDKEPKGHKKSVQDNVVWSTLSKKQCWKSDELQRLLEDQLEKRDILAKKKEAVEKEAERLKIDRKKNVKQDLEELQTAFIQLKSAMGKVAREKLPSRLERPEFYTSAEKADELEKASAYLTVLNFFKSTSEQIDANMESELETDAIELFHRLKRIEIVYLDITDCTHLLEYGKGIIGYWEHRLRSKLVKDFEVLLEAFGWPLRLKTATPTLEIHEKFHRAILNLSKISSNLHEGSQDRLDHDNADTSFSPILPIQIMMSSLKRRFRFHFFSDKQTSESSRPEWYFSQVKTWLHDLVPFIRTHLEQVTISEVQVSSVIQFIRCVSEMLVIKIDSHLQEDLGDGVFVRILEEAVSYENEIGDFVGDNLPLTEMYMPPFVNTIFSRPDVLQRWLAVERKACLEKLDEMFASPSAWNRPVVPGPPEIVDLFLAVIRCLTDRFAHLQKPMQRLEFLQLFNDLLEDFHVRCLQMWKSKIEFEDYVSKDVLIDYIMADALEFVHDTLQEWEYLPFFTSLAFFYDNFDEDRENSEVSSHQINGAPLLKGVGIFSNACSLFWCLADDILSKWCHRVIRRISDEIKPYCKLKWQTFEAATPADNISEQLLLPLQILKDVGKAVSSSMDPKASEKWMKKLAVRLDEMLIETVIFPNRFSRAGVVQLSFDFNNGIFPVFAENRINETLFFGSVFSALTILNISTGEAMLLYECLMDGHFEAHELALAELNVSICQSEAIKILRGRCDLRL